MFGHRKNQAESLPVTGRVCSLLEIPQGHKFKIVEIKGGPGLHRRLLALGFHRGDLVTLNGEALLGGPVLVKNLNSDTRIALGRGIARKVLVEPADENER
ncbi:MAG: FeoA family protein [Candidatus Saccharicenans sp.]|jgi:Fe2+ transport system protein FeoA|nr:ferrous iron transport protein A [Candidatus Saccharicenans sp.]MDH7575057.1 FeoA family protein [Candidatus Saccharicenans sp.]